jgi:Sec-independent protein secretion pathway component TatC
MPLLQHLNVLRQKLFRAFFVVILTTVISFKFSGQLNDNLAQLIGGSKALVSIEVIENFAIFMRVALPSGIVSGMLFVVYQLLRFILPRLKACVETWLI